MAEKETSAPPTTAAAAKHGTGDDPVADATPATMTVRVANRGYTRSYEGVRITEVTIPKTCPRCGGPRGGPYCGAVHEDGEVYPVHNWDNPCGHIDYHPDVLIEAGVHPPQDRR